MPCAPDNNVGIGPRSREVRHDDWPLLELANIMRQPWAVGELSWVSHMHNGSRPLILLFPTWCVGLKEFVCFILFYSISWLLWSLAKKLLLLYWQDREVASNHLGFVININLTKTFTKMDISSQNLLNKLIHTNQLALSTILLMGQEEPLTSLQPGSQTCTWHKMRS